MRDRAEGERERVAKEWKRARGGEGEEMRDGVERERG